MSYKKLPEVEDSVKLVNCKAALKYKDIIFTVKASPYLMHRKPVVTLKEIRGYFEADNLEIINK